MGRAMRTTKATAFKLSQRRKTIMHHAFFPENRPEIHAAKNSHFCCNVCVLGVSRTLHIGDWPALFRASSMLVRCITRVSMGESGKFSFSTGKLFPISARKWSECFFLSAAGKLKNAFHQKNVLFSSHVV